MLTTKMGSALTSDESQEVILQVGHALSEIERAGVFKLLPDHAKHYVPRSEYLFKRLQPLLDDLLFLGVRSQDIANSFISRKSQDIANSF